MASAPGSMGGPLATQPLSPWAQRFRYDRPSREEFLNDGEIHSGFAPEAPRLHPMYYADTPQEDERVTTSQLDKVFNTEDFQRRYFKGLESWQAGPLMSHVWFSDKLGLISGGHHEADYNAVDERNAADIALDVFHSERIQVDERKWFTFLKKERWFDTAKPKLTLDSGNWSVDNPRVWEVLSISIELLDRVLKALIADKHVMLETILYGLFVTWGQINPNLPTPFRGANFLFSRPFLSKICQEKNKDCPTDFVAQLTPGEWTQRLETLMKPQTWGMVEHFSGQPDIWGVTLRGNKGLILIDIGPIEKLVSTEITLAERCMLHLIITTTMLHEMFHSLHMFRKSDKSWPGDAPPLNMISHFEAHEPLVDDDAMTELGFAAEERIFGGQLYIGPRECKDLPFGTHRVSWPEPYSVDQSDHDKLTDHPSFRAGASMSITRVPALHASKLLSAAFWNDPDIPEKSANYFHLHPLLINDTAWPGRDVEMRYPPTRIADSVPARLLPGEREMLWAWSERCRDWEKRRDGWYQRAREAWRRTPWADYGRRRDILAFGRAFERRDELECRLMARQLARSAPWKEGGDEYFQKLPPTDTTHKWIFHAIGLLMLSALPIRDHKLVGSDRTCRATYEFVPSQQARGGGGGGGPSPPPLHPVTYVAASGDKDTRGVRKSVFYDPFSRDRARHRVPVGLFAQRHYLDLLDRLLAYVAGTGAAVPTPWLRAISRAAAHLRRRRGGRGNSGGDDARGLRSWVDVWAFAIPAYDESVSRFENGRWTVVE